MAFAHQSTYFVIGDNSILGSFEEKDCGNYFEFSENRDEIPGMENFPHKVWVTSLKPGIDGGFRYARVLKTVAYICVDEDAHGDPVVEKWYIKQHRLYPRPESV